MNNAIPDDVKHLVGDEMMDTVPQGDDDLDYESFVKEYSPEAICQGEDHNGDDEGANDPLARSVPTDDEFDPPTAERLDYAPTRHELIQLARYWVREDLRFVVDYYLFGFTSCSQSKLVAFGGDRLRQLEKILGDEAVQTVVEQVEDEYRWSLGDKIWKIFKEGTRAELEVVREEIWELNRNGGSIGPRTVPQGLLPADIGVNDCALETWLEFGAYCKASGIREKLAELVRRQWEEFAGNLAAAGEP